MKPSQLFGRVLTIGLIVAAAATAVPTVLLTASLTEEVGEELAAWREPARAPSAESDRLRNAPWSIVAGPADLAAIGVALFVVISFVGYVALALVYIGRGDAPYAVMTLLQLVVFLVAALAFV